MRRRRFRPACHLRGFGRRGLGIGGGGEEEGAVERYGRGGVRKLVQLDSCREMLYRDDDRVDEDSASNAVCETFKLVAEEERYPWSFPEGTFDLVVSSMAFHWVNDLPKLLLEIKVSLIGDLGVFDCAEREMHCVCQCWNMD